ncbi:aminoglycoside phosphotransferase [Kosakonia sp. CCTCC M2018092]|uniref:phosphotransferase n=1 Tax=Kosakonia sp. CCTCC M2018092 TaxID=2492396 RepID=UPI000F614C43|nr:phosphotransferase [Kosakonia sp. CCTCC M2018092]AZI86235.1 aminoglycoside phosphotransferase [Kosakonia sp. CCTCC M2018092]
MTAENLAQMGAARVVKRVNAAGITVIEKAPVSKVEYAFYHQVAPELKRAEILTPALLAANASSRALTLEAIPSPVSQQNVTCDAIVSMLARLHRFAPDRNWHYHTHRWPDAQLELSLHLLALPEAATRALRRCQRDSDRLFAEAGLISGDSNAGNWGQRENGEFVLFDWERFSTGHPAIDLAPLIKGMGTPEEYQRLAARYCRFNPRSENDLARDIALAKAWIVSEVITLLHQRQKADFPRFQHWYRCYLPDWLKQIETVI